MAGSVLFLCIMMIFCGQGAIPAFAEESTQTLLTNIDYASQTYTDIPSGFNVASEDVIYKLSCQNPRAYIDTEQEDIGEYLSVVSFKASMGCQIYFVDGYACNLEDASDKDTPTTMYQDYYEILQYDEGNQFVYIKFKNLATIETNAGAAIADIYIKVKDTTYNAKPQYVYVSDIEQPVTVITADDVFFSTEVKAGTGGLATTGYNLYSLEYTLKVSQKVAHLIDTIEVSFVTGGSAFELYQASFGRDDGVGESGYLTYECITLGDNDDLAEQVRLQATITYGDNSFTVMSGSTSLLSVWQTLVDNDFAGYEYETYLSEEDKTLIRNYVVAYQSGFYLAIKGIAHTFAPFSGNSDIKTTSLIFRAPIENFRSMSLHWGTNYWKGYTYHAYVRIDGSFAVTTSVYKMITNEDGTITVGVDDEISASTITYDETVAAKLLEEVEIFLYDGYIYVRVRDESMVMQYFPQSATSYFNGSAGNTNNESVMEANTATIIYDEYNHGLLQEIKRLSAQIEEMREQVALLESKREELNAMQSTLDGLRVDYTVALGEIDYLYQQMEVMREEYEKTINALRQGSGGKVPSTENPSVEESSVSKRFSKVVAASMVAVLTLGILLVFMPKKRRKKL